MSSDDDSLDSDEDAFYGFADEDDDNRMLWEAYAGDAVKSLIETAQLDEIRGTVVFRNPSDDGRFGKIEFSTLEDTVSFLTDIYNEEWYTSVPFDGGEAVFEDDAFDAVENLLDSDRRVLDFLNRNSPPANTEVLVTANELLLNTNASSIIRVSLDEINDELIAYLATHPQMMREMRPRAFEELVAAMFRNHGYDVTLTPRTHDGGMDVVAIQKNGIGTAMIIIECKRHAEKNTVGVGIVRGLYGVVEQKRATQGIIATTSFFTRQAEQFRNTLPYRIGFADFNTLTTQIKEWKARLGR